MASTAGYSGTALPAKLGLRAGARFFVVSPPPDLGDLLAGKTPGRCEESEITCFANNVGTGLQFAAAGAAVLEKARRMKIGTELPDDWFSEDVHP